MNKRFFATLGLTTLLLVSAAPAQAASLTVTGTFLDHNGNPVADAYVAINHPATGAQQVTRTSATGAFEMTAERGETISVVADSNATDPPGPYEPLGPKAEATGVLKPGTLYVVEDLSGFVIPTILGTDGDDVIAGTPGRDVIFAGAGNDSITGLDGADIIIAGTGDDTVEAGAGPDIILAGSGDDTVYGGPGDDEILGHEGADVLRGEGGDDQITDHKYDSQAINRLVGGAGDDNLFMSTNAWGEGVPRSYLIGGAGNDRINAPGTAVIRAGAGDDVIQGVLRGGKTYCGDGIDVAYPNNTALPNDFYDGCEQVVVMA